MADTVPDQPDIWTDGSREPIPHLDVEVAAEGAFVSPVLTFDSNQWDMRRILMAGMRRSAAVCPMGQVLGSDLCSASVLRNSYRY